MICTVTEGCENQAEPGGFGCYACGEKPKQGVIQPGPEIRRCRMCDKPARKGALDCSKTCQWRGNKLRQRDGMAPKKRPTDATDAKLAVNPAATDEGKNESEAQRMRRPMVELSPERQSQEPTDQVSCVKVHAGIGAGHVCNLDNIVHSGQIKIEKAVEFLQECHAAMAMMPGVKKVSIVITVDHQGEVTLQPPTWSKWN